MNNNNTLADVVRTFGSDYYNKYKGKILPERGKVLHAIACCQTEALGGSRIECKDCTHEFYQYHSCRNRHCPKCQKKDQQQWLYQRLKELPAVPYFHVVFTIPNEVALAGRMNRSGLYKSLFAAAKDTIHCFFAKNLKMKPGIISILHTWGQTMSYHPHIHMLVSAGGLDLKSSEWKNVDQKFMFPVRALSKVFRAKTLDCFRKNDVPLPRNRIMHKDWVVFCKAPVTKPDRLLLYLSRYVYRIAIDDSRIKAINTTERTVTFSYKDYKQKGRTRTMTLDAVEFIHRFLQHVLPSGFVKVRYYGIFAHVVKQKLLALVRKSLKAAGKLWQATMLCLETLIESIQVPEKPQVCPKCKGTKLIWHCLTPVKLIPRCHPK